MPIVKFKPPPELLCPITTHLMLEPVFTEDGHTYEKTAIEKWLIKENKNTSPLTGENLQNKKLTPNHALKGVIQSLLEKEKVATKDQFLETVKSGEINKFKEVNYLEQYLEEPYHNNDGNSTSILHIALQADSSTMAILLIEEGAPIKVDEGGHPIILSIEKGWKEVTKKLIERKQYLDTKDPKIKHRPLGFAASRNDVETIQMLVDAGAPLYSDSLVAAAVKNKKEAIELLIKLGVNPQGLNHKGDSVLHIAARKGFVDLIKLLVQHVPIDLPTSKGCTALIVSVASKQIESVKLLLQLGANPNFSCPTGWTSLFVSIRDGNLEITKLLAGIGKADIDTQDNTGHTALHVATSCNKLEEFNFLLSAGINYGIKDNHGKTAVQRAGKYENLFIKALEDYQQTVQSNVKKRFREEIEQHHPIGENNNKRNKESG